MKKAKLKKLQITKETIRDLTAGESKKVVGATGDATVCHACAPVWQGDGGTTGYNSGCNGTSC